MKLPDSLLRVALFAALALQLGQAGAEPDALERPATMTARAASSVMLAVARADKRLVAVGERGIVLLSDDDGATWRQARVPVSVSLTNVHFRSSRLGWAVGHSGVVLHTADGGETWVKQLDGKQAAQLVVEAAKARGSGDADAGRKLAEAERLLADGPDKPFLDVRFLDDRNGLVVGAYGLLLATSDGGKTWRAALDRIDNPRGKHLYAIHAADNDLVIVGEQGAFFASRDRGNRFTEVKTPYAGTYFGVTSADGGHLLAFGLRGNAWCSSDGGHSWQRTDTGAANTLAAGMRLADGSFVLADEGGRVLRGRACGQGLEALPVRSPSPFTGVAQAADGALILSGTRGITRLTFDRM